jgi:hypothetical protein
MAERLSTGFADAVNAVGSVKTVMNDSVIHIYSGIQPATADAVETGTLLMIVTQDSLAFVPGAPGNGLSMDVSTLGVLAKTAAETWSGNGLAAAGTGTVAGWFRWYANTVVTGASTTAVRLDGAIGTTTSYEMQLSNTTIVEAGPATFPTFTYTTTKQ